MIKSFRSDEAETIFKRIPSKRYPAIQNVILRRLRILDSAGELQEIQALPGNRLEKLKGDRESQYSIRINDQYCICFVWRDGDVHDVEIVDYHQEIR
jgi:proteic killer suppression protein